MQFCMECESIAVHNRSADGRIATCVFAIAFISIILYWMKITTLSHTQHMNSTHCEYKYAHWHFKRRRRQRQRQNQNAQRKMQLMQFTVCCQSIFPSIYWIPICIRAWVKRHTHSQRERHVRLTHDWNIQNLFAAGNCILHRNARIHLSAM